MTTLSITTDQLSAAGSYIAREWGDYGYRFEGIETRTHAVSVFRVVCSDGGRFSIVADKWGNTRHLDTHNSDDGLAEIVAEMHAKATEK